MVDERKEELVVGADGREPSARSRLAQLRRLQAARVYGAEMGERWGLVSTDRKSYGWASVPNSE